MAKHLEGRMQDRVDTGDVPEVRDCSGAARGRFYRPVKVQKTLRLDADVVDYFARQGAGYQTRMNAVLRAWMLAHPDGAREDDREPERA